MAKGTSLFKLKIGTEADPITNNATQWVAVWNSENELERVSKSSLIGNGVTLDTVQTITARKTFNNGISIKGNSSFIGAMVDMDIDSRLGIGMSPNISNAMLQILGPVDVYNGSYRLNDVNGNLKTVIYVGERESTVIKNMGTEPKTVLDIRGKTSALNEDREASLTLTLSDDISNEDSLKLYNSRNNTTGLVQYGLRLNRKSTGDFKEFVFDWMDGSTITKGFKVSLTSKFNFSKVIEYENPGALTFDAKSLPNLGYISTSFMDLTSNQNVTNGTKNFKGNSKITFNNNASLDSIIISNNSGDGDIFVGGVDGYGTNVTKTGITNDNNDNSMSLNNSSATNSWVVIGSSPNFKGINGNAYYGSKYTDFTYVQKKYVDDAIASADAISLTTLNTTISDSTASKKLVTDFNIIPDSGTKANLIYGTTAGGNITNGFGNGKWGSSLFLPHYNSTTHGNQIGFDYDGNLHTKTLYNSNWSPWKKVLTNADVFTTSGGWTKIPLNLPMEYQDSTSIIRYKIISGTYVLDVVLKCNGLGNLGQDNVILTQLASPLTEINIEKFKTINLESYVSQTNDILFNFRIENNGSIGYLIADLRPSIPGTFKLRAALPISSTL